MKRSLRAVATVLFLIGGLLLPWPSHAARKPKEVVLELPDRSALGTYTGANRITLGQVSDRTFAESDSFLGMGPQATYAIQHPKPRAEMVEEALLQVLKESGLLSSSPTGAAYTLDVEILRDHFTAHQTVGRFRLRSEVFLKALFHKGGETAGSVVAAGNAEMRAQVATQAKVHATYAAGFNDALHKLLQSEALSRLAGEGWKPGTPAPPSDKHEITRIRKDEFYGPSKFIMEEAEKVSEAFAAVRSRRVYLQAFEMKDEKYAKSKDADLEYASNLIPELVGEHLRAFHPGALEIGEGDGADGIIVSGEVLKYKAGSLMKRALVGLGAGKDKLEVSIRFQDGSNGKEIHSMEVLSTNWGAIFQLKRGQVRDMADQLAKDLAYLLVSSLAPDYSAPVELELVVD